MRVYKQFILGQREIELNEPFIIINENISPQLYQYLQFLDEIIFKEGKRHKFCGRVKSVVSGFINYWADIIHACLKEADLANHEHSRMELLDMIHKTIFLQHKKQKAFAASFLPAEDDEELKHYNRIEAMFQERLNDYKKIRSQIFKYENQIMLNDFAKRQIQLSIKKKQEAFAYAQKIIANHLAQYTNRIKVSINLIMTRIRANLQKLKDDQDIILRGLMDELYDQNKKYLLYQLSRQEHHRNKTAVEVAYGIKKLREKIERRRIKLPILRLEEEYAYWEKRLKQFLEIESSLIKIQKERKYIIEQQKRYEEMRSIDLPGLKRPCFENMGEALERRLELIENTYEEATKALMTFFAFQGKNDTYYSNHIGTYAMDRFDHQVYFFDYFKSACHVNCDGSYRKVENEYKYYFDTGGRYVINDNGEKLYQCAPCTSTYKLGEEELLVKTTKDCGHSDLPNPNCQMDWTASTELKLLPVINEVQDIKETLAKNETQYLRDTVCNIVIRSLCDTEAKRPKNPIYYLGHRILHHKYFNKSLHQIDHKLDQSDEHAKAVAATRAWQALQVKHRKPEEFDEMHNWLILDNRSIEQNKNYYNTTAGYND